MLVNDIEPFKADQVKLLNLFIFVLNDVAADKTIISTVIDELIKTVTGTKLHLMKSIQITLLVSRTSRKVLLFLQSYVKRLKLFVIFDASDSFLH